MQIPGADVQVYRIKDPVRGDDPEKFAPAVLAAPIVTRQVLLDADCIIIGGPGRQGGFAGEVRLFLDSMAEFQKARAEGGYSLLMVRCRLWVAAMPSKLRNHPATQQAAPEVGLVLQRRSQNCKHSAC